MKIWVLGATGMLGRYVYLYLRQGHENVIPVSRKHTKWPKHEVMSSTRIGFNYRFGEKPDDVIINCIGVIKPQIKYTHIIDIIDVNARFPHLLANYCQDVGKHCIHISTDCVFSGKLNIGSCYDEMSEHDATDIYGKTKSLGEPDKATVLRTSIIGEEVGQQRSLISWLENELMRSMEDPYPTVRPEGYTTHYWNGVTCLELAEVISKIITGKSYWQGVRHIHSKELYTKAQLLKDISSILFSQNPAWIKDVKTNHVNRLMTSLYSDTPEVSRFSEQLQKLKEFSPILREEK